MYKERKETKKISRLVSVIKGSKVFAFYPEHFYCKLPFCGLMRLARVYAKLQDRHIFLSE